MSQLAPELPNEVRLRIDEYLDAVERVLIQGGVTRTERRNIVDEVESQIYEMLAARTDQEPAAALTDVLAKLDAPEAYAPDAATTVKAESAPAAAAPLPSPRALWSRWRRWWSVSETPRFSPPAVVAACWAGGVAFLLMAVLAFRWPPAPLVGLLALFGLTAPVGVTVLGFLAVRRIRRTGSKEHGLPLALIETFFFPILLANLALIGILAASEEAGLILLAALVIIAANVGLARYAWRRFGGQFLARVESL
ncbi:MAG TPA: hypothetical protein VG826_20655 [Pirellulales bacterium]|nr:hypothetical protein [Pirellulales bacterium]